MQFQNIAEKRVRIAPLGFAQFIIMMISKVLFRGVGLAAQFGRILLVTKPLYLCHRRRPKGRPVLNNDPKANKPETPQPKPEDPLLKSSPPPPPPQNDRPPQQPQKPEQPNQDPLQTLTNLLEETESLELQRTRLEQIYQKLRKCEYPQIQKMMNTKALRDLEGILGDIKKENLQIRTSIKNSLERLKKEELEMPYAQIDKFNTVMLKMRMLMNETHQMLLGLEIAVEATKAKEEKRPWVQSGKTRKLWRKEQLDKQKEEHVDEEEEKIKGKLNKMKEQYKEFMGDQSGEGVFKWIYNFVCDTYKTISNGLKNVRINPLYLIALIVLYAMYPRQTAISEKQFQSLLKQGKIQNLRWVTYNSSKTQQKVFQFDLIDGKRGYFYSSDSTQTLIKLRQEYPNLIISPDERASISLIAKQTNNLLFGLLGVVNIIYVAYMMKNMNKGGAKGGSELGLAFNKQKFDMNKHVKVRFADVAGLEQSKLEITEFVDFLKNPKKYEDLGARIPKGALLTGPPGTGKTMLAKATAGEAGVPFFFVSGSDFVQMFVGLGAARVRDLFKQAKANSPSIIFIDEIDAIGKKRDSGLGSNDERDGTLNQLLVQMDGFGTDNKVIVMAATNRKELLDNALTRPGRLDRMIQVTLPDLAGRMEIFMVHLRPLKLSPARSIQEYARRLATLTPGFSGADIANLCNEAAIYAARANKEVVESHDFEMATERIIGGLEKKSIMSKEEREVVSVHESGHAVVSWFLEGAYPLLKLTIIPRSKGSLGFAQYLPSQTRLQTKQQLLDRICFTLAGRCAEQYFFKRVTTGAADDLDKAYKIAHALVTKYGMSEKLGFIGYRETEYMKPYSGKVSKIIDQEIKLIIERCAEITRGMVQQYADLIRRLSEKLLEKETLDGREIREILGERPFKPHSSYKAYLQMQQQEHSQKLPPPQPSPS